MYQCGRQKDNTDCQVSVEITLKRYTNKYGECSESTEDELLVKQMERWEMTMKRVIEKEMRMTVPLERSDEQIDL